MLRNSVECLVQVNSALQEYPALGLTKSISLRNLDSLALDRALRPRIIWI